ncbi:MAG TPA: rhodanese-like domain-containing protein [Ktedonobacterales bacterium]|nr:rhodanese-like domain-containing protein [Ktedonobacterales bacterium]
MSDTPIKTLVRELLREARVREEAMVATLSATEREAIGTLESWSAKDTISQIAFWKHLQTGKLQTALRGEPLPEWTSSAVVDPLNAANYAHWQRQPWEAIAAESLRAYQGLLTQVEAMSERELADDSRDGGALWPETLGNGIWYPYTELIRVAERRGDSAGRLRIVQERLASNERVLKVLISTGATKESRANQMYNLACYYTLADNADRALALLAEAFYTRRGLMALAQHDSDLDGLRELPAFQALFAGYSDDSAAKLIEREAVRDQQTAGTEAAPVIVDVRNPGEYASGHIAGAVNIPLANLAGRLAELPPGRLVVTYCNHHHPGVARCEQAVDVLAERGYQAYALNGGYPGWKATGLPVEEPAAVSSGINSSAQGE